MENNSHDGLTALAVLRQLLDDKVSLMVTNEGGYRGRAYCEFADPAPEGRIVEVEQQLGCALLLAYRRFLELPAITGSRLSALKRRAAIGFLGELCHRIPDREQIAFALHLKVGRLIASEASKTTEQSMPHRGVIRKRAGEADKDSIYALCANDDRKWHAPFKATGAQFSMIEGKCGKTWIRQIKRWLQKIKVGADKRYTAHNKP